MMTKRVFGFSGLYIILFSLFCLVTHVESTNPGERVGKDPGRVTTVEVVRARFGSGPDDLGTITPKEANPEGPMSFALGRNEEIYILDQINSRVQVFKNGKRVKTIPIPASTIVDIDVTADNKIVLLDNLVKKSVHVLDAKGKILSILPLEGRSIPYAPAATGIYSRGDGKWSGIWVELEDRSVRIAKLDGTPNPDRISVPGKFSFEGRRLIRAEKTGDSTAAVYRSKEDRFAEWDEYKVSFNMYIAHLLGIWDDRNGKLYLGAFLEEKSKALNIVGVFSPEGKELGREKLFVQRMPHEIYRSVRVSPEGKIFQMALDDRGGLRQEIRFISLRFFGFLSGTFTWGEERTAPVP